MSTRIFALGKIFTQQFLEEFEKDNDMQTLNTKEELVKVAFRNQNLTSQQRGALSWVRILIKNRMSYHDSSAAAEDTSEIEQEYRRVLEHLEATGFFV